MKNKYPRPQMKRESFLSLDGTWIINGKSGTVPSCQHEEHLFYQKNFSFHFENKKVLLHIDAADQVAEVSLNGHYIGIHEGGYLSFYFDVTQEILEGDNHLEIKVTDELDPLYPYGKQKKNPSGMWYTPISGIWKSVWIEQVPEVYIQSLKITPDLKGANVEAFISNGDVLKKRIEPGNPELWSPKHPKLYYDKIEYQEDLVEFYFALRKIEIKEVEGIQRVCLNDQPIFLNGVLDQGYWPHTLFIPNTEDGYEKDILRMKELGFNMLRKHIKIEDEEFYYQCDKLGMLVLQDMVQNGQYHFMKDTVLPTLGFHFRDTVKNMTPTQSYFVKHSENTINHLYSHPCIIAWTIFNEGWGQFNSDILYRQVKEWDNTRLVDAASGWFAEKENDFDSLHIYFRLKDLNPKKRPLLVSECGGYSLSLGNEKETWGYGRCQNKEDLTDRIIRLYQKMIIPKIPCGVCGVVYTQLSDVEGELNGLYSFNRECKINKKRLSSFFENVENPFL